MDEPLEGGAQPEDNRSENQSDTGGAHEDAAAADSQGVTTPGGPVEWYYATGGQSYGPVNENDLKSLARQGYFSPDDYVYSAYLGDWVRADSIYGLFEDLPGAAAEAGPPVAAPPPVAPQQGVPQQLAYRTEYAGFWIRVGAVFIDGLVLSVPNCLLTSIINVVAWGSMAARQPGGLGGAVEPPLTLMIPLMIVLYLLPIVVAWLYYGLMESSRWQATLGKRACGIMVTDLEGRRISFGRASGRYFASIISNLILGIGYIVAAFTERKQTFHDMIANTVCVYGRQG